MSAPVRCRRKFLRFFPGGFQDETYLDWERDYKVAAHARWTKCSTAIATVAAQGGEVRGDRGARCVDRVADEPALLLREDGVARCGEAAPRRARVRGRPVRLSARRSRRRAA